MRGHLAARAEDAENLPGAQRRVVGRVARQDNDLQTPRGSQVEHALESLDTLRIGASECIIEYNWQTTVVIGSENFGHGESDSGSEPLARAKAQYAECHGSFAIAWSALAEISESRSLCSNLATQATERSRRKRTSRVRSVAAS